VQCAWCEHIATSICHSGGRSNPSPPKIGCMSQTLPGWVKRNEVDNDEREGETTSERERLKAMEREVKQLRRANEILKLASAFFAQARTNPGSR
jgi:transposase-like protein